MNKREGGIRLVQESIAGENAQDYDRMYSVYGPEMWFTLNGTTLYDGPTPVLRDLEKNSTPQMWGNPDRTLEWIDATDDRVVFQYRLRFDHIGEFMGFPATGHRVEFHGMAIGEHDGQEILGLRFFADQGEMNRQLSGTVRTAGTASAAPSGPLLADSERERHEAIGERLIRTVYEAENDRDIEGQLACYADPLLDHFAGRVTAFSPSIARAVLPTWWASVPGLHREIEEVLAFGNRALLRWHMTADAIDGKPVDQHGCSVVEHNGERITKFWAYYPDLAQVFPAILQLE